MNTRNRYVCLGYADVDISPSFSVEMVGFDRQDNQSRGTLDPLLAQIVVWDDQSRRSCLISIDSIGFTVGLSATLRELIADKLSTDRERVMLCFSHTHAAPNAAPERVYYDYVCAQVLAGIDQALKTLAPVKAAWGVVQAEIGVNRRDKDGRLDRRIGILKITDAATDRLRLVLLRVTAHANVLSSDNYLISADYFGRTRALLENQYGYKVMLCQGAAGNVRPRYQQSNAVFLEEHAREAAAEVIPPQIRNNRFEESMQALDNMAAEIQRAIAVEMERLIPEPIFRLALFSEIRTFSSEVPTPERAGEIAAEAQREAGMDGTRWLAEVDRLYLEGIHRQQTNIEIQFFVLNDGCLCGIPNEAMCEIALDISQKANAPLFFFGGYTNGCEGYLPSTEEFKKGGFEVLWSYLVYFIYHGRVMPLNGDTADRLTEFVIKKWKHIQSDGFDTTHASQEDGSLQKS